VTDDPPNFNNFPCMAEPEMRALMQRPLPCPRCRSRNLAPVSDLQTPPIIAIACDDCGEIEGDGATLAEAVTNWNAITPEYDWQARTLDDD
jgi:hypothetical protein